MSRSSKQYLKRSGCLEKYTSARWILAFMLCLLRMCQTALRQSIGMALVCMAERPSSAHQPNSSTLQQQDINLTVGNATTPYDCSLNNGTNDSAQLCHAGHREFIWDATFEGLVLSSYYYGYLMTPLLASYLDRMFGSKRLIATCIGLGAIINLITPALTRQNKFYLVALRIIAGTTNGMIDPAVQTLWAVWAPKTEIAHLAAVEYAGVSLGGIFTFLISGFLCQIPVDNGWPLVFYFYGSMNLVWVILWFALIYNKPSEHPRISVEEQNYIESETHTVEAGKYVIHPPWVKILSSPAVWAFIIASSSFMWVYSWILCYLPMYMQDVLRYNISQNAILSSLPFVGKFASGIVAGYVADKLLRTKMSVTFNRKMFQMIGCLSCAVCTLVCGFLNHESRNMAVVLLVLAVTTQNIASVTYRINLLEIAPRYASFILGITYTIAVAVSLTAPLVTSAIVTDKTEEQWQILFSIVAALCVVGAITFLILGRATVQDWAMGKDEIPGGKHDNSKGSASIDSGPIHVPKGRDLEGNDSGELEELLDTDINVMFLSNIDQVQNLSVRSPDTCKLSVGQTGQDLDAVSQRSTFL